MKLKSLLFLCLCFSQFLVHEAFLLLLSLATSTAATAAAYEESGPAAARPPHQETEGKRWHYKDL